MNWVERSFMISAAIGILIFAGLMAWLVTA